MDQDNSSESAAENHSPEQMPPVEAQEAPAEAAAEATPEAAQETPAPEAEAPAPAGEAPAEATQAAEAPKPAAPKRKPPIRKPGPTGFDMHLGLLLAQLYADYDLKVSEAGSPASRYIDLWSLPEDKRTSAPAEPSKKDKKDPWPTRIDVSKAPDFRLHLHVSTVKDPNWSVPAKDIDSIIKDKKGGLVLLMADQKGYFLPSYKVADLAEHYSPAPTTVYKITGPRLRKAAIARFFSLAGLAREIADVLRR